MTSHCTTMKFYLLALIICVFAVSGCTNKTVYQTIQHQQRLDCEQHPPSEYNGCLEQYSEPYESYKKSRDDLLDDV